MSEDRAPSVVADQREVLRKSCDRAYSHIALLALLLLFIVTPLNLVATFQAGSGNSTGTHFPASDELVPFALACCTGLFPFIATAVAKAAPITESGLNARIVMRALAIFALATPLIAFAT